VPLLTLQQVSVEVMDVLYKHGMQGVAGLVLRKEFVEAAELLKKVLLQAHYHSRHHIKLNEHIHMCTNS
jgi:hypothetical protein